MRSGCASARIPLLLLILLPGTVCTQQPLANLQNFATAKDETIIDERRIYVPLGAHVEFPCHAYDMSRHIVTEYHQPEWVIRYFDFDNQQPMTYHPPDASQEDAEQTNRFVMNDTKLYGFALQDVHNNSLLSCTVNFSSRAITSRIIIIIQGCPSKDQPERDDLNPCRYGKCTKNYTLPIMFVECTCLSQYTGPYCDVPVASFPLQELKFYSPILLLLFLVCLLAVSYTCIEKLQVTHPLRFEKFMPAHNRAIDLRALYPSTFVSDEDRKLFGEEDARQKAAEAKAEEEAAAAAEKESGTSGSASSSSSSHTQTGTVGLKLAKPVDVPTEKGGGHTISMMSTGGQGLSTSKVSDNLRITMSKLTATPRNMPSNRKLPSRKN